MSKHIEKYPGLYARCKRERASYQVMYIRCRSGKTVDEAFAIPVRKAGRPSKNHASLPLAVISRLFAWERPEWNARAVLDSKPTVTAPVVRRRYIPKTNDTSPYYIARIRAAYCDEFIKTGVLNVELGAKLRTYADEQNKHKLEVKYVKVSSAADTPDPATVLGQSPERA